MHALHITALESNWMLMLPLPHCDLLVSGEMACAVLQINKYRPTLYHMRCHKIREILIIPESSKPQPQIHDQTQHVFT